VITLGPTQTDNINQMIIISDSIDAHGLKIQGEGQGGFCQILGGRVYRGCENFGGRVQFFGVLLNFC
jgi:hypothetical protein